MLVQVIKTETKTKTQSIKGGANLGKNDIISVFRKLMSLAVKITIKLFNLKICAK
jgi:hypothetical protein